MKSIRDNNIRIGNFTSSKIGMLMTLAKNQMDFGKPALTYVKQKNWERRLGRFLESDISARPLSWGKCCEEMIVSLVGLDYKICSQKSIQHKEIEFWCGSPDYLKNEEGGTAGDFKCPQTLKAFCEFSDCTTISEVRENCDNGEEYYWQIVSNAILTDSKFGELTFYVPYQNELAGIRKIAEKKDKCDWIYYSEDDDLPYLIKGNYYENIAAIGFEIPESDKDLLTENVLKAGKLLIQR